jgi:hypothetical protein
MDLSVSQSYESCMKDEGSARQQLIETWSKYTPQDKSRCVGQTEDGGVPGYVEVVECLLVTIRVIDLAADEFGRQPREAVELALQPVNLDRDIRAIGEAGIDQAFAEGGGVGCFAVRIS